MSLSETILTSLHARISALAAAALRGEVLPERVPAEGLLILRDGEPAEAEKRYYAVQEEFAMRRDSSETASGELGGSTVARCFITLPFHFPPLWPEQRITPRAMSGHALGYKQVDQDEVHANTFGMIGEISKPPLKSDDPALPSARSSRMVRCIPLSLKRKTQ